MKPPTKLALCIALLAVLLVVGGALAMTSTNFRLDWYELQPGASGASVMKSDLFQVRDSVGAPLVLTMSSSQFRLELGYWPGARTNSHLYLPLTSR